jgi:hypothetical protein
MEYRRDYVEEQIAQMGLLLRKLLEKLLKAKPAGADSAAVNDIITTELTLQEGVDITLEVLTNLDNDQLIGVLKDKYGYTTEHLKLLADLFYELPGSPAQEPSYRNKALFLYQYYLSKNINVLDLQVYNRIDVLKGDFSS